MRKLMWFSIGYALACGLCAYLLPDGWILPLCLLSGLGILLGSLYPPGRSAALCCLGCLLGFAWWTGFQRCYLAPAMAADGTEANLHITATDYSYATDYGSAVDGWVTLEGKRFQIRVYLDEEKSLEPGDTITGTFRMRYTPGGKDSATYHPGKGIFLLGYQRGEAVFAAEPEDTLYPAELAQRIRDILREAFPADVFGFAQALLLGDDSQLDYATDTALQLSGIRHIVAVSGLHVTILYSLIQTVTFRKHSLTALLGIPAMVLFAAVAGFTPSVTRASIMVILMMLAQLVQKEYDPPTALAFAVLVMLTANPMVITSAGFQLSVGCVAGIQLFQKPVSAWLEKKMGPAKGKALLPVLKRWLISSVSVTLNAMSLTTPLCAVYFGAVSLVSVVTNLLTLWVVNLIFNGLVVTCVLGLLSMEAAGFLAGLLAWPIRYVLGVSRALAAMPLSAVYTQSPYVTAWLIFVYLLLGVFLFGRKRKPLLLGTCAAMGLCMALLASWAEPLGDTLRVTMLDVGQGQSILLQARGQTYLVDCGGDSDTETADLVAETLLSQGISYIDGIILTHCDRDHAGGLSYLLSRIGTGAVFYPATEPAPVSSEYLMPVSRDMQLTLDGAQITIFGPIFAADENENSLCVLFTVENYDILITGDRGEFGEAILLHEQTLPDVELLVAGHHGSKYSTSESLLQAVRPEYIFVSAGADNPYGHPAQEMLDRAAAWGAVVFRTDLHGTLTFRR